MPKPIPSGAKGAGIRKLKQVRPDVAEKMGYKKGGKVKAKSKVNSAGNYTKPTLRKRLYQQILNSNSYGTASGKWSARKAQALARLYKQKGGGYRD